MRGAAGPTAAAVLVPLRTERPRRSVVHDGADHHVAAGPRGIPHGACTSPALSDRVARRPDRRLGARLRLTCTRYADDPPHSGDEAFGGRVGCLMARVRHLAAGQVFAVDEARNRIIRRGTAQTVTGLVVGDRPDVPGAPAPGDPPPRQG